MIEVELKGQSFISVLGAQPERLLSEATKASVEHLPLLRSGDEIDCPSCQRRHKVYASPLRDDKGRPVALAYDCGPHRHIAGLYGRCVIKQPAKPIERMPMGKPAQTRIPDARRQIAVRQVLVDGKRIEDVAHRLHIGVESVEKWINDPKIRGEMQITDQSGYKPRHRFTASFKQKAAERVKAGESPAAIAREFLGLTPGMIRNWSEGIDMQPEPALDAPAPIPPRLVQPAAAPPPPPAPPAPEDPPAPAARHPKRDEAVAAYRGGMMPAEIIAALDLKVTADAIRDWAQEDRPPVDRSKFKPTYHGYGSRYTEEQKAAAVARWVKGEISRVIAVDLGCSHGLIDLWAKQRGAVREVTPDRPRPPKYPDEIRELAVKRVRAGETRTAVAADMGLSLTAVASWVLKAEEEEGQRFALEHERRRIEAEITAKIEAAAAAKAPEPPAAPPPPAPAEAPSLITPPPAKKIMTAVIYKCPHCQGAISLPPAEPGVLRVTSGNCPSCNGPVIL